MDTEYQKSIEFHRNFTEKIHVILKKVPEQELREIKAKNMRSFLESFHQQYVCNFFFNMFSKDLNEIDFPSVVSEFKHIKISLILSEYNPSQKIKDFFVNCKLFFLFFYFFIFLFFIFLFFYFFIFLFFYFYFYFFILFLFLFLFSILFLDFEKVKSSLEKNIKTGANWAVWILEEILNHNQNQSLKEYMKLKKFFILYLNSFSRIITINASTLFRKFFFFFFLIIFYIFFFFKSFFPFFKMLCRGINSSGD